MGIMEATGITTEATGITAGAMGIMDGPGCWGLPRHGHFTGDPGVPQLIATEGTPIIIIRTPYQCPDRLYIQGPRKAAVK